MARIGIGIPTIEARLNHKLKVVSPVYQRRDVADF